MGKKNAQRILKNSLRQHSLHQQGLLSSLIQLYNLSYSPNWAQVEDMLMQAVKGLNKACGVILHSDQGWQYQIVAYRRYLG